LLKRLAHAHGVDDSVRFTGYVQPEKAQTYYAMAWVYVLPSITLPQGRELWGLVVNEAFNQGLPVIASDAVGAAAGGMVQDGKTGLVVPERSSAALVGAINRILDDEPLRARMSSAARQMVAEWDNERMTEGFRRAVDYVMKKTKPMHSSRKNSEIEPIPVGNPPDCGGGAGAMPGQPELT